MYMGTRGCIELNGLKFDFKENCLSIMDHRVEKASVDELFQRWPQVSYRETARCIGRFVSRKPVFVGAVQIKTRILHTVVNNRFPLAC
jgi:hypothetical protein